MCIIKYLFPINLYIKKRIPCKSNAEAIDKRGILVDPFI